MRAPCTLRALPVETHRQQRRTCAESRDNFETRSMLLALDLPVTKEESPTLRGALAGVDGGGSLAEGDWAMIVKRR